MLAMMGHSVGEYTAMYASHALSFRDGLILLVFLLLLFFHVEQTR
mgnify:CR=1 FL=1